MEENKKETIKDRINCCRNGPKVWCIKYFFEGQMKRDDEDNEEFIRGEHFGGRSKFLKKYRRIIAVLIPFLIVEFLWFSYAIQHSIWEKFTTGYTMTLTMIFGSIIAGMTSEGGGAVAFPVMTLLLKIDPVKAKDFSLLIQSCGMSCASFSIFFMKVQVEYNSIIFCSIGAIGGGIFGYEFVDKKLTAAQKKMLFVCIWFTFAFSLFLLNFRKKRKTFRQIVNLQWWTYPILLLTGFVGGIFTSFTGSGVDICSFSILTLLFRVSEKVATPTSVVLMAFNSFFGVFWRNFIHEGISTVTWDYFLVCAPIVVVGAPIGSLFGTHFHRLVLAALVYIVDVASIVTAFIIIKPTGSLLGLSLGAIGAGFIFFLAITKIGDKLLKSLESNFINVEKNTTELNNVENSNQLQVVTNSDI
ncbi:DgyrCDS7797 [Dimorphilus gyrociliatus]|uniref:DgyrCDS7797 n=1 Tax=Dimorphilus gyrociliatus TaxID=2664684 RepID=A0A7I8VTX6_9ANNE|nr:DgyrCDS7797 [Dimorphilus gyrociliatus]